jgi:hypothetical protein
LQVIAESDRNDGCESNRKKIIFTHVIKSF